jgi:hypothetical protein
MVELSEKTVETLATNCTIFIGSLDYSLDVEDSLYLLIDKNYDEIDLVTEQGVVLMRFNPDLLEAVLELARTMKNIGE